MLSKGSGRALALISILVGVLALIVPEAVFRSALGSLFPHTRSVSGSKCPLGYGPGSRLPEGAKHPGFGGPAPEDRLAGAAQVFFNCSVWTGDPQNPHADALAVGPSGRFLWVGRAADVDLGALPAARVTNLQGRFVIPGLVDSHVHLINGGLSLSRLDLREVSSKEDFIARVCTAAGRLAPGAWLLGGNWDESKWGGEPPAAAWVNDCTQNNPVWLNRMDGHMGLANSRALALAGVDSATTEPPGGVIARDAQGSPTGLLADNAMPLVISSIPPSSIEARREGMKAAMAHALSKGITMVHDMGRMAFHEGEGAAWDDLEEVYLPAAHAGELLIRVYSFVPLTTWRRMAERVQQVGTAHEQSGRLYWGGVKEFADGSLGSHTALMHEPYADNPSSSGTRTIELELLRDLVTKADAANLQVAIHAIGDRAVDDVLGVYASLPPPAPGRPAPRRHRIEHAQHISGPGAAQRMTELGVVATPNPLHLLADAAILGPRLGAERAGPGRAYAFRTLLQAGVNASFASDWPVVPLDPLGSLHAAVHRGQPAGAAGPEAVGYGEALRGHTVEGAYVGLLEQDLGMIREGMLADFVVLSGGLESEPQVEQTYVDGSCAYGCPPPAAAA